MRTTLVLTGIRGDSPLGLLVACGVLDLMSNAEDPAFRLGWCRHDGAWRATVESKHETTEALAGALVDAVHAQGLDSITEVAGDLNKVLPADLAALLADEPDAPAARLLTGLCAELPRRPGGQAAMTPLVITSFYGRRSVFGTVIASDRGLTTSAVRELLDAPWVYTKGVSTLGLDPGARQQDGARLAVDPSGDKPRGVEGAISFAARGLAMLPPLVARGRSPRVAGVNRQEFSWPIWSSLLRRGGVRAVLGRAWKAHETDRHAAGLREGSGIGAIYASSIVRVGEDRRMGRARLAS